MYMTCLHGVASLCVPLPDMLESTSRLVSVLHAHPLERFPRLASVNGDGEGRNLPNRIQQRRGYPFLSSQSTSRRLRIVSVQEILRVTALEHGVEPLDYSGFRSPTVGRDMAAWLCRRWTGATLAERNGAWLEHLTQGPTPAKLRQLRRYKRPILCTEYMARPNGSRFDPVMGYFKHEKIAAYNWGFVAGKTRPVADG